MLSTAQLPPERTSALPTSGVSCRVIGTPIAHSLSPALHQAAYRALGLDWSYTRDEVDEPDLERYLSGLGPEVRGLSLTMPLKQRPLAIAARGTLRRDDGGLRVVQISEVARRAGAVNTAIVTAAEIRFDNTDVPGLASALRAAGVPTPRSAVVLGTGGTARSSLTTLADLGCAEVTVLARDAAKAERLADSADPRLTVAIAEFRAEAVPPSDLAICTVTAGAADALAPAIAQRCAAVFDVVYHPWPTAVASAAERAGRVVLNGLDLLAHQAVGQVELMTGRTVPAELLLAAGRAALSDPEREASLVASMKH